MARFFHALLLGLLGAGIVHIAVLLMLPGLSAHDAWSRLEAAGDYLTLVRLSNDGGGETVGGTDPFVEMAACRFDLSDAAARIRADRPPDYWSLSVFDREGRSVYSLNDRTMMEKSVDVVLVTPAQMIELRKGVPEEMADAVLVELKPTTGIVALRTFQPDQTFAPAVDAFFSSARCEPA